MTPRTRSRIQIAAIMALVTSGLVAVSGCDPRSLAYFLQPFQSEIPPPEGAPVLEGKKVVILCNVTSAAVAEYPSLERDVPRTLADILRKKVKKITIVEPDKVSTWVEAHPRYTEPADAARDFGTPDDRDGGYGGGMWRRRRLRR